MFLNSWEGIKDVNSVAVKRAELAVVLYHKPEKTANVSKRQLSNPSLHSELPSHFIVE